jgi:perosamine synthetase
MKFIPIYEPDLGKKEKRYVNKCLDTNWISSQGKFIHKFEKSFSKYCNVLYGVSTSNGTTALHLALLALDIKEGDEVILPNFTFISSANVIKHCNAKPIFVDCKKDGTIDPDLIEKKITNKTKVIMPVHLYGTPCDMDPILKIAKKYNLYIVEDCAEAHGAEYKGRKVGSFGNIGCFSFYANKIITTGEGGMCVTNNKSIAEKINLLKNHGMSTKKKYWHEIIGFNYRMTNIQAAIGLAQLSKINRFIRLKRRNAKLYNSLLKDVKGIILPKESKYSKNVYWMYSILLEDTYPISRDEFILRLRLKGIDSRPFFYPVTSMPSYKSNEKFLITEDLSKKGINLPSSATLTKKEIIYISKKINELSKR